MQRILVICGPTATGKTKLALYLADKFNGEIISADSRQVYRGMDIGTGKDIPPNSKFQTRLPGGQVLNTKLGGFYQVKGIPVWGYDLVSFKKNFSVSKFIVIAEKIIRNIQKRNKLPILVGGTGFYIKGVIDGIASAGVARNSVLRNRLAASLPSQIFELLKNIDPGRAESLNSSDQKNTRRLIRALEIAQSKKHGKITKSLAGLGKNNNVLILGLLGSKETLYQNIKKRVTQRINMGFEKEIKKLIKTGFLGSPQAVNTLGYKQWLTGRSNKLGKFKFVNNWINAEQKYVKRQITWFKKDERINWFNIENKGFKKEIENMVKKWYHDEDETGSSKSRTFV